tara:strand:- start:660 stop:1403 length:744 start_codon:yes stop_codon:yes gene_type:complete
MAIDIKKMRQKLSDLHNKGGNGNTRFWKPQDGENVIRILPTADGDPFKHFHFHYNLGDAKGGVLCPKKNFGNDCPVCDFVSKLYNNGDEESRNMARKMVAKSRFFSPVLARGEEVEGVKVWGYSKTVYENLLQLVLNPDYGDITDPQNGTDLVLVYGKAPGAMFPSTNITARRKTSPATSDTDLLKEVLDTNVDFDKLFEVKSTEDVAALLDKHLLGDDGEASAPADVPATKKASSVDEAFQDLLAS